MFKQWWKKPSLDYKERAGRCRKRCQSPYLQHEASFTGSGHPRLQQEAARGEALAQPSTAGAQVPPHPPSQGCCPDLDASWASKRGAESLGQEYREAASTKWVQLLGKFLKMKRIATSHHLEVSSKLESEPLSHKENQLKLTSLLVPLTNHSEFLKLCEVCCIRKLCEIMTF